MRKISLALVSILLATYANARSYEEAMSIAREFLNATSVQPLHAPSKTVDAPVQEYYIFSAPEGSILISGNDYMPAVIGYSPDSNFDTSEIPIQLKEMLDAYTHVSSDLELYDADEADNLLYSTAAYNQFAPYNDLCPDGSVTGCTNTALAIKMKYHNWPDIGRGQNSYTTPTGQHLSMDYNIPFDWDNMLDDYNNGYNSAQANAIATLMYACGVATETNYSPTGSGASMNQAAHGLVKYFCYSPEAEIISSTFYSVDEWHNMLRQELRTNGPVVYAGSNEDYSSSHAFIVDGYNGAYYHVNWGWGGHWTGYFLLSAFTPSEDGSMDYSYAQGMIINAAPDYEKRPYCPLKLYKGDPAFNHYGLLSNTETVEEGQPVNVVASGIRNVDTESANGQLGVFLTDSSENIISFLGSRDFNLEPGWGYRYIGVKIDESPASANNGDKLIIAFRKSDDDHWAKVSGDNLVPSSASAYGNTPITTSVRWSVDHRIKCTKFGLAEDKALLFMSYVFTLQWGEDVEAVKVTVNGEEIQPYLQRGDLFYYYFVPENECLYEVECIGIPEITVEAEMDIAETRLIEQKTEVVPVSLRSNVPIVAFQCDIILSEGLNIDTDEYGNPAITLTDRADESHVISAVEVTDNTIKVVAYSNINAPFMGLDGPLFNLPIKAEGNADEGSVTLTNIFLTPINLQEYECTDAAQTFQILHPIAGDANDDGRVTIADVTFIIAYILGDEKPNFSFDNADIDGNGRVTITDAAKVVDIIMHL